MGGKSSSQTVGYKYYLGLHMVWCQGPVDKVLRLSSDDNVAWVGESEGEDIVIDESELYGGTDREGGVQGTVSLSMGEYDQDQNDYLKSKLGSDVPAFRGVLSTIFEQCYLGMNPYLKNWSMRASRIYQKVGGGEMWYSEKAGIKTIMADDSLQWDYQIDSNNEAPYTVSKGGFFDHIGEIVTNDLVKTGGKDPTPTSGYGVGTMPFGNRPSDGYNTLWPKQTSIWVKRDIYITTGQLLYVTGRIENGVAVYLGGVYQAAFNYWEPYDAKGSPEFKFVIDTSDFSSGTYELVFHCLDDADDYGNNDWTYLGDVQVLGQEDMNPAHIIYECMTSKYMGLGYDESDLDMDTFYAAADTLYEEGMGISIVWKGEDSVEDFITEICRHIDAVVRMNPFTGQFQLVLVRDDYVLDDLITLNEDNVLSVSDYERIDQTEAANKVIVNYWSSGTGDTESIAADDVALMRTYGEIAETVTYSGFTTATIAATVAARDLRALSLPLLSATIECNRDGYKINVGDVFKFEWPNYHNGYVVMRALEITMGGSDDSSITIKAVEDVFGYGTSTISVETGSETETIKSNIRDIVYKGVQETPFYEAVQQVGEGAVLSQLNADPDVGYMMATAADPSVSLRGRISINSGAGYVDATNFDFCPVAIVPVNLSQTDTTFTAEEFQDLDLVTTDTHAKLGDEIVSIIAVDADTGVIEIGRGCLDTVPQAHAAGTALLFWDEYLESDGVQYTAGDILDVKLRAVTNVGMTTLDATSADTIYMDSRAIRPYPPGKVRVNDFAYPEEIPQLPNEITFSWAHRDRLQQTGGEIYDESYSDIGPEDGTTYKLELYNKFGVLVRTEESLTGNSYTWSSEIDDSGVTNDEGEPMRNSQVTFILSSMRGEYESYQKIEHTFSVEGIDSGLDPYTYSLNAFTYDLTDVRSQVTWVPSNPDVIMTSQYGFLANGYSNTLELSEIPSWLSKDLVWEAQVSVQDNISRSNSQYGDSVLLFTDGSYAIAQLKMYSMSNLDFRTYYVLIVWNGSDYLELAAPRTQCKWRRKFPNEDCLPQGLAFMDATRMIVCGHDGDAITHFYVLDRNTLEVLGTFSDTTYTHVASIALNAAGEVWAADYTTDKTIQIDVDASLASGTLVTLAVWDTSVIDSLSCISFATINSAEYVLLSQYAGTPYTYFIPVSFMGDGNVLALSDADLYLYFRNAVQGTTIDGDNNFWLASSDTDNFTNYGNVETLFNTYSDGETPTALATYEPVDSALEDLAYDNVTGEIFTMDEGNYQAIWSFHPNVEVQINTYGIKYDGISVFTLMVNGYEYGSLDGVTARQATRVLLGGPHNEDPDALDHQYYSGYIKGVRLQSGEMTPAQRFYTMNTENYETDTLTITDLTGYIVNPGAETGDTTGWTNETGTMTVRDASPSPRYGSYYFMGGTSDPCVAYQRFDLVNDFGFSETEIDAGEVQLRLRWSQCTYSSSDPMQMGLRVLDASETEIDITTSPLDHTRYNQNWYEFAMDVIVTTSGRYVDIYYKGDRTAGTNNDGYWDNVRLERVQI